MGLNLTQHIIVEENVLTYPRVRTMKLVILSIRPKFAEAILSGKKRCEFRKGNFPKDVDIVVIYSTKDVGKIVGWFRVKETRTGKPQDLWRRHERGGGIGKDEFDGYYSGSRSGVCLKIQSAHRLYPPIDPFKEFKGFIAPQSFRYFTDEELGFFSKVIEQVSE